MQARAGTARAVARGGAPPRALDLHAVAAGVIATFALTVLASALLGALIYFSDVHEGHLSGALYYAGLLTVAAGGAVAGRRASARGWLHGGLAGVGYVLLSALIGSVVLPGAEVLSGLGAKVGTAFLAGAVGGVIGVNA